MSAEKPRQTELYAIDIYDSLFRSVSTFISGQCGHAVLQIEMTAVYNDLRAYGECHTPGSRRFFS